MNPHLHISLAITLTFVGVLLWFVWDMRSIIKSLQRKTQLSIDGKWEDFEKYYERAGRSLRPFVWLHRKYLLPGNLETQYALFLYNRGQLERALEKADLAIRQIENKPMIFQSFHRSATFKTFCGALRTRALILGGLARYAEARETAARLQNLTGMERTANSSLAFVEYYCGHLDEALALAESVTAKDHQYDAMRAMTAYCYSLKGDFSRALQALSYVPSDVSKFYTRAGEEVLNRSPEGAALLELKRKKLAGVIPPARLILMAQVYIAMEDFVNAGFALDDASISLGPEPGLQMAYNRHRACSLAGQGKSAEAEKYIERVREIVKELPKRSLLWEAHYSIGRSYLYLGRSSEALAEFAEAERAVLHPIERHTTAYWTAKAYEASGNHAEALRYYQMVVADAIPSWMRQKAEEIVKDK